MNDKRQDNSKKKYNSTRPFEGGEKQGQSKYDHIQPLQLNPLEIKVYNNFDKAMRTFRSLVQKERVLSIFKESQFFEKPSDKKRRRRNEMKRKLLELEYKSDRDPADYPKKQNRDRDDSAE